MLHHAADPFAKELVPLLQKSASAEDAMAALSNFGEGAVPVLGIALTNANPKVRADAALELGYRRTGADTVARLLRALKDESAEVRSSAAFALARFPDDAELVVPALMECLDDPYSNVGISAASSLGALGPLAAEAVPRLKQLAGEGPLKLAATGALIRIAPEEAEKMGIRTSLFRESFE